MAPPNYPFVPKSTAYLRPGHFWGIPLDHGGFACGRVIQLALRDGDKQDSRSFLAGLLDWTADTPPRSETIAERRTIVQGDVHIATIRENAGAVVGYRPLEMDGIEPDLFLSQSGGGASCYLQRGYQWLRPATEAEQAKYPVFSTWGYRVIKLLAEDHFGKSGAVADL